MRIIKEENYKVLTEASLNRLVRGHDKDGYAVLSASRNERTVEENNKCFEQLKKDVKGMGYSYVPVFGGYVETDDNGEKHPVYEKSLYVLPKRKNQNGEFEDKDFDSFVDNMFQLGKKFEQEEILIKYPDEKPAYYFVKNKQKDMEFNGASFNDIKSEYFTAMKKWDGENKKGGSPQRFSFKECYLSDQPHTVSGATARSMNGELVYFDGKNH